MFLTSEKVKIKIADINKYHSAISLTKSSHFKMGNYAIGQIGNDAEKGLYTCFVSNDEIIDVKVSITVTDDDDAMALIFEETLDKFNKLNKHLVFKGATVENTGKQKIKNIVITYTYDKRDMGTMSWRE